MDPVNFAAGHGAQGDPATGRCVPHETAGGGARPPLGPNFISLEMGGLIECWFFAPGGAVNILLAYPVRCWQCKTMHVWFVNREGRTRCVACDETERSGVEPRASRGDASRNDQEAAT